jgi:hypothetical protein
MFGGRAQLVTIRKWLLWGSQATVLLHVQVMLNIGEVRGLREHKTAKPVSAM